MKYLIRSGFGLSFLGLGLGWYFMLSDPTNTSKIWVSFLTCAVGLVVVLSGDWWERRSTR